MPSRSADASRVYLLVSSADATGGVARASASLANHLVDTHPVEMIALGSLAQRRHYPLDPRVEVTSGGDLAPGVFRSTDSSPGGHTGDERRQEQSALVDRVLPNVLRSLQPGVVISTRPLLHLAVADHAPSHCVAIAQDHANLEFRRKNSSVELVARAIDRLDQFVVLTDADAAEYRALFPQAADRIRVIRNAAPWPVLEEGGPRPPVIVAAGELSRRKGFDRLVRAYRPVARRRPEWRLHIYGEGPRRDQLEQLIIDEGLSGQVVLKGRTREMEQVLEQASIFALTSRFEGFPMVLVEAMSKGVPVVSFDCPRGPAEIVVDSVTGRLVNDGDIAAFSDALMSLVDDDEVRRRMSEQSLRHARQYQASRIVPMWTDLFVRLTGARRAGSLDGEPQTAGDEHPLDL